MHMQAMRVPGGLGAGLVCKLPHSASCLGYDTHGMYAAVHQINHYTENIPKIQVLISKKVDTTFGQLFRSTFPKTSGLLQTFFADFFVSHWLKNLRACANFVELLCLCGCKSTPAVDGLVQPMLLQCPQPLLIISIIITMTRQCIPAAPDTAAGASSAVLCFRPSTFHQLLLLGGGGAPAGQPTRAGRSRPTRRPRPAYMLSPEVASCVWTELHNRQHRASTTLRAQAASSHVMHLGARSLRAPCHQRPDVVRDRHSQIDLLQKAHS